MHAGFSAVHGRLVCSRVHGRLVCSVELSGMHGRLVCMLGSVGCMVGSCAGQCMAGSSAVQAQYSAWQARLQCGLSGGRSVPGDF